MKKVLFVAHVDSHIRHFHLPYLKYFKDKGYEVHVATSNDENEVFPCCDVKHTVCVERSPFKVNNLKAIKQMKKILDEEHFDIIHCHTPMGGVIARIAAKKARKEGTKVFYTAHGFHFYKGAPKKYWMIFYPVEKYLSKFTDVLITINQEDFEIAKTKFRAKRVELVHGVGVDDKKFTDEPLSTEEKDNLKKELKINDNDFVMMYVAELIDRKNQVMLIEAMKDVINEIPNIKVFLIGNGVNYDKYDALIKELGVEKNVILLGYRRDVPKLLKLCDVCISTSTQEGMGLNLIEGLLSGVPIIASKIRGHLEFTKENINGLFFENTEELVKDIVLLTKDMKLREKLAKNARESVKDFTLDNAYMEEIKIYESELK